MTIHYHGTPITPVKALMQLSGRCFCVSFADPRDVKRCHDIGQSVMIDNGAFTLWTRGGKIKEDWSDYYRWIDAWLDYPNTWAVIPDVIGEREEVQDSLIKEFPFGDKGAPVWHMNGSIDRLLRLCDEWPKVCIGSCGEYRIHPMTQAWTERMDLVWNEIEKRHKRTPYVHMLRGMKLCNSLYPFASVDSTDIARNHHLHHKDPVEMADRWDRMNNPGRWNPTKISNQLSLLNEETYP